MADSKVSQLTSATLPLVGTELVYLVQGGNSRRATAQDIAALTTGTDLGYTQSTRVLTSSTGADVTLPVATASLPGLMAAADKALTDALIAAGVTAAGTVVTIPHIHGDLAGSVYIHVKNTSGGQLVKGTPVRVTGAVGDTTTLEVTAADAATAGTMPAIGILGDTLANNASGHAVVSGELTGLGTGSYSIGQALYVAAGGGLTGVKPTTGTVQQVAIVGRVHASTGSVTVTISAQLNPNWDTAYSERLRWDGGASGLDAATGRASLGLGGAATLNVGTTAGTVAAGDDSRITGALSAATAATTYQPLDSDLTSIAALTTTAFGRSLLTQADAPATRSTLGLGSLATQSGTFSGTSSGTNTGDVTLAASVADVLSVSGQELQADDPGADRLVFWDDSAGKLTHLTLGTNLAITGTTLDAAGGSTDLGYTAATRLLTSSTGADVTLPLATTSDAGLMAAADKTKLDGVAAGATANATDAQLRDRSTHTGTQAASTITGLATVATTGAYADLSGKPTLGTAAALDVAAAGDAAAGQVVKGNDSRLTDARTPTAHTQTASTISDSTTAGRALLTAADAAAQRTALGLATVAASGAYADLSGTPSIPAAADATPLALGAAAAVGTSTDYAREDHVHAKPSASDIGAAATGSITGSGLTVSATDRILGRSSAGSGAVEEITCTAAGRALLDDADAAAQRTTLGLATVASSGSYNDLTNKPTIPSIASRSDVNGVHTTGSITSGTASLTVASATGIVAGMVVVGEGITPGTTVSSISGTSVTLSANAATTLSSDPVGFYDNLKALSPGSVGGQLCRAWVNFNGTSTVSIRASFNVSSITDNGTGNYTINFTSALPDTNYAVGLGGSQDAFTSSTNTNIGTAGFGTNSIQVLCRNNADTAYADFQYVTLSCFR